MARKRKPARIAATYTAPVEVPRCTDCVIHAATIGPIAAARYSPPLGPKVKIRAKTGPGEWVCPRCDKIDGLTLVERHATGRHRRGARLNV